MHAIYSELAEDLKPALIHSKMPASQRRETMTSIQAGASLIIVCVNMLGEGFDLPQLKIAALHDMHKSLAITLQFLGRFVRTGGNDLGSATVIANLADARVDNAIRDLYSEDADWNMVVRTLAEGATQEHIKNVEFFDSFEDIPEEIPLQNILPKMTTVVFRIECASWNPQKASEVISGGKLAAGPSYSQSNNVMWYVTRDDTPVEWGNLRQLRNVNWNLFVFLLGRRTGTTLCKLVKR